MAPEVQVRQAGQDLCRAPNMTLSHVRTAYAQLLPSRSQTSLGHHFDAPRLEAALLRLAASTPLANVTDGTFAVGSNGLVQVQPRANPSSPEDAMAQAAEILGIFAEDILLPAEREEPDESAALLALATLLGTCVLERHGLPALAAPLAQDTFAALRLSYALVLAAADLNATEVMQSHIRIVAARQACQLLHDSEEAVGLLHLAATDVLTAAVGDGNMSVLAAHCARLSHVLVTEDGQLQLQRTRRRCLVGSDGEDCCSCCDRRALPPPSPPSAPAPPSPRK